MAVERLFVLDACAVIALLDAEEGADAVERILEQPSHRCWVHAINLCEIYYHTVRAAGEERANQLEGTLAQYGLEVDDSLSSELWKAAGRLKAQWRRISLADCFAVALTMQKSGTLVTSDHHELDRLAEAGICDIEFIR